MSGEEPQEHYIGALTIANKNIILSICEVNDTVAVVRNMGP